MTDVTTVDPARPVLVVGAGISGLACARALTEAGVPVRVVDRGRRSGGRMSGRRVESTGGVRVVDLGASYFTVSGDGDFSRLVAGWEERGLARPWTDTFAVLDGSGGESRSSSGPVRWASPTGLRSLVEDLVAPPGATPLDVVQGIDVEGVSSGDDGPGVDGRGAPAVVLAMPDPQAADLLPRMVATRLTCRPGGTGDPASPCTRWEERWWPDFHGAFVNDSDLLVFLADDGSRRGDGAPVLVAHTAPDVSSEHLDAPASIVPSVLESLGPLLGVTGAPAPTWARAHRWSLASPLRQHEDAVFGFDEESGIGVCGDAWGERSKVQTAWSRDGLGRHLAGRFTG